MKPFEIESRLRDMTGQVFMYKKRNHRILRFEIKETSIRVVTDQEDIVFLHADAPKVLPDFLPVDDQEYQIVKHSSGQAMIPQEPVRQTLIASSGRELKDILMDNIKKVQNNKDYIPQAIEVNNQVKSMIDLAKAEVELIKAFRG